MATENANPCRTPIWPSSKPHQADFGDVNTVQFAGVEPSLRRLVFGDRPELPIGNDFDQRVSIVGADGQLWEVWGEDSISMYASRARTPAEREAWIDDFNTRISTSYFSKDRQEMLREIGSEMHWTASNLASEVPMPRALRRSIKKKLLVLAAVQLTLTTTPSADMAALRTRLAAVGLVVQQPNYAERLAVEVH